LGLVPAIVGGAVHTSQANTLKQKAFPRYNVAVCIDASGRRPADAGRAISSWVLDTYE